MTNMDDNGSDFCKIHIYLQPFNSWEVEKIALAYEDCRMKDNGEGKEFTPSFFVGEPKICAEEGEVVDDDKVSFILYMKEEKISYLKSSFELPHEVEYKPPSARCELGNLKENNLMQREEHSSYFCTIW